MRRRSALCAGLSAGLSLATGRAGAQVRQPSVVFLNPGEPVERGKGPQWRMAARLMTAAAQALDVRLEVLYAERDHLLMLQQAAQLAKRTELPDYVVIVNEKLAGLQMLRMFAGLRCKVLLMHNDLTAQQRAEIGNERERITNWIGTVTTEEARSEYRMMQELARQLGERVPRVVGITGDPSTPVSGERADGVQQFITRSGRGSILQTVFSDWSAADAERKADVLLARHQEANVIWAANDTMALGALRAVKARGAQVLVGGAGAWPEALQSMLQGGMAASVGSHFFLAAWALVLLHDYHHGLDFARQGGPRQRLDYMVVVNRENAPLYQQAVYARDVPLDFSAYSKVLHPKSGPYEFDLARLVRT